MKPTVEHLEAAILRLFPKIPQIDLNEILAEYQRGFLMNHKWLYFAENQRSVDSIDRVARIAVCAHLLYQVCEPTETLLDSLGSELFSHLPKRPYHSDLPNSLANSIEVQLEDWK